MTVQELIDTLQGIQDKTREILVLPADSNHFQTIDGARDNNFHVYLFCELQ